MNYSEKMNELMDELNKSINTINKLDYFKKELNKILDAQENKDDKISKSIESADYEMQKTMFQYIGIQKARGYGVGTIREWKGQKYRKIAPGKWRRIYTTNSRGAMQSVRIIKSKIMAAKTVDELLQLVMENINRFQDENGKLLPIVEELKTAVNESKGKINASKPKSQEKNYSYFESGLKDIEAQFNKISAVDYNKKDFDGISKLKEKADNYLKEIAVAMRKADDDGDFGLNGKLEDLKYGNSRLFSKINYQYEETKKNHEKQKFADMIQSANIDNLSEKEKEGINNFQAKVTDFINEKHEYWSVERDLVELVRNTKDIESGRKWLKLNGINNFDEFYNYIRNKKLEKEIADKKKAAEEKKRLVKEKIDNINKVKTFSKEEIEKAFNGVKSLQGEIDSIREAVSVHNKEVSENKLKEQKRKDELRALRMNPWDDKESIQIREKSRDLWQERIKINKWIDEIDSKMDEFMDPIAYYYLNNLEYEKDDKINNCKTAEDVENLIKSKDWYSDIGKNNLNLKGVDTDACKDIFKCLEYIFALIPENKGANSSVNTYFSNRNVWAYGSSVNGITVNKKYWNKYDELKADYESTEGGFHPMGTLANSIIYHEYYHVLTAGHKDIAGKIKNNVTKRLKMKGSKGGPKQADVIRLGVSEYALKNADEFGAECFAQALGAEKPSVFAIEVLKETLKYRKFMRGLV